eukprot:COSAG01_NODE_11171_length_1990_cov_227.696986_3_plen_227_part_00
MHRRYLRLLGILVRDKLGTGAWQQRARPLLEQFLTPPNAAETAAQEAAAAQQTAARLALVRLNAALTIQARFRGRRARAAVGVKRAEVRRATLEAGRARAKLRHEVELAEADVGGDDERLRSAMDAVDGDWQPPPPPPSPQAEPVDARTTSGNAALAAQLAQDATAARDINSAQVRRAQIAGLAATASPRSSSSGGDSSLVAADGESKRLVAESPWSPFTSECQRF